MTMTFKLQIFFILAAISLCAIVSPALSTSNAPQDGDEKNQDWKKGNWGVGNGTNL
jgi:hypothetical protein